MSISVFAHFAPLSPLIGDVLAATLPGGPYQLPATLQPMLLVILHGKSACARGPRAAVDPRTARVDAQREGPPPEYATPGHAAHAICWRPVQPGQPPRCLYPGWRSWKIVCRWMRCCRRAGPANGPNSCCRPPPPAQQRQQLEQGPGGCTPTMASGQLTWCYQPPAGPAAGRAGRPVEA